MHRIAASPAGAVGHIESLFGKPRAELLEALQAADEVRQRRYGCLPACRVLDQTAVVALVTGRNRYVEAAVWRSVACNGSLIIPAAALATALVGIQEVLRPLVDAVLALPSTVWLDLDRTTAEQVAELAGAHADVLDLATASAVVAARRFNTPLLSITAVSKIPQGLGVIIDEAPAVAGKA